MNDITFISIPKTGSRAIHLALGTGKKDNHRSVSVLRPSGESFAVIRNPHERLVSWWAGHRRPRHPLYLVPFEQWVRAGFPHHWDEGLLLHSGVENPLHQHQFVEIDGEVAVTHLVAYARLNEWVEERFGVRPPVFGVSRHAPWETYYTPELRKLVDRAFPRDIELFRQTG